jgi:glycosyltransferase
MKVSIVTVSYNSGPTIADTLVSVATQSYSDIEHIVVDGGSSDDTVVQIRRHCTRVAHWVSEGDCGIYDAMNKGLARATGDIVGFLNADDVLDGNDAVQHLVTAAEDADVVYGNLVYVRADDLKQVVRTWKTGHFRTSRLRLGWMPPHPTFYVRRTVLAEVGLFDISLRIAADYDFMLRCLTRSGIKVAYLPHVLVRMRAGGVSNATVANMLLKSREDLRVIRKNAVGGWLTLAAKNVRKLPQFL